MASSLTEFTSTNSSKLIFEDVLSPFLPIEMLNNESDTDCPDIFCNLFEEIGPFPESMPPPPPLPPHFIQFLKENHSLPDQKMNDCNFCNIFSDVMESELVASEPEFKTDESWSSTLFISVFGLILVIFTLIIFIKIKKLKPFSSQDKNLCLKQSPLCSPSEHCIAPVINEKSPQSVIFSCSTRTSTRSKYWRQTRGNSDTIGSKVDVMDHYSNIHDGESCLSSPVYAELDANGIAINHDQVSSSLLMNDPSTYAHTYSEIAEAMRMATLGSSTLISDASYYNVTYLPYDQYQKRPMTKHHSKLKAHGSAAPLLDISQQISESCSNYKAHERSQAKSIYKPNSSQIDLNNHPHQQTETRQEPSFISPYKYEAPLNPLLLPTFEASYAYNFLERQSLKRPLPAVP
ncbi:uncharacterized protein LOC107368662 [Tetranychus urticae]|uniref:uncharacterized protein LOC107368662 n=1 Tax=Tetranychus urticae TaxID=32264 RepID=UPI00077BDB1E|nr:uncharacterized protein LOC107368662 [Tetranychus urticae]